MKNLLLAFLFICSISAFAQSQAVLEQDQSSVIVVYEIDQETGIPNYLPSQIIETENDVSYSYEVSDTGIPDYSPSAVAVSYDHYRYPDILTDNVNSTTVYNQDITEGSLHKPDYQYSQLKVPWSKN